MALINFDEPFRTQQVQNQIKPPAAESPQVFNPSTPPVSTTQPAAPPQPGPAMPTAPAYHTDWGGGDSAQQTRQIADAAGRGYAPEGYDATKWADLTHQSPKYTIGRILAAGGTIADVLHAMPGWKQISQDTIEAPDGSRFDLYRDFSGAHAQQFQMVLGPGGVPMPASGAAGAGVSGAAGGASGAAGAGGIFTDPATAKWEQLVNMLTQRLQQPQPTWTPAQLELQQTQVLDPLERQRQALRQQVTQHFASMGHGQNSGPLQQALQDIDRQFQQQETTQRAGIANQAIGREDTLFANNENRALAAANLYKQVPQYADTRMQLANQTLMPNNPAQLFGAYNQFQQTANQQQYYNQQQNQAFWDQLGNYLSTLFK